MLSQDQTFDDKDVWSLLADELPLLPGMTDTGRLGFDMQLKFRQIRGHHPETINAIPSGIVHAIPEEICLGLSTNVGLKRIASQQPRVNYDELRDVKRRFI